MKVYGNNAASLLDERPELNDRSVFSFKFSYTVGRLNRKRAKFVVQEFCRSRNLEVEFREFKGWFDSRIVIECSGETRLREVERLQNTLVSLG